MNRKEIKKIAREMINGHLWSIIKPFLVVSLITITMYSLVAMMIPKNSLFAITTLCDFAIYPLIFGAYAYVLNFVRKKPYDIKNIFSYYNIFIYIFALYFLISLFTALWTVLLIIPGIIAALSYKMAPYVMIDGTKDPLECIKKSKQMIYGYKWDFFKFKLSFFGWILLVIPTFGLILIFLMPYMTVSELLYYEELRKITKFD